MLSCLPIINTQLIARKCVTSPILLIAEELIPVKMLTKIKKFYALRRQQQKNLLQAYFLLGIIRAAILTVSFKRLSKSLQHHLDYPPHKHLNNKQLTQAKLIGWAVTTAARHTPWDSNCLTQALTAQKMLNQHNIAGMFFLGARKGEQNIEAHAWLECDTHILTGKPGHETFTILSTFSWH